MQPPPGYDPRGYPPPPQGYPPPWQGYPAPGYGPGPQGHYPQPRKSGPTCGQLIVYGILAVMGIAVLSAVFAIFTRSQSSPAPASQTDQSGSRSTADRSLKPREEPRSPIVVARLDRTVNRLAVDSSGTVYAIGQDWNDGHLPSQIYRFPRAAPSPCWRKTSGPRRGRFKRSLRIDIALRGGHQALRRRRQPS